MKIFGQTLLGKIFPIVIGSTGRLNVDARDGDKIWSYSGIVEESSENLSLTGGAEIVSGTPVPAGEIWKITHITYRYGGTVPATLVIQVQGLASAIVIVSNSTMVTGIWYIVPVELYMQADDYITYRMLVATATDTARLRYAGVKMQI